MGKDLSKLSKKELSSALDDILKLMDKKIEIEKEMSYNVDKIEDMNISLDKDQKSFQDLDYQETKELKEAEVFISEEEYIEKQLKQENLLNKSTEASESFWKVTKKIKLNRNLLNLIRGISVAVIYNIFLFILYSIGLKFSKGDLIGLNIILLIFLSPIIFFVLRCKKTSIACAIFVIIMFVSMHSESNIEMLKSMCFILALILISIFIVVLVEIIIFIRRKIRNLVENKKVNIERENRISELKVKYQEDRDIYFNNKETRKEDIKQKYVIYRKSYDDTIKTKTKELEEAQKEQSSLKKELTKLDDKLQKGYFSSLHEDYQNRDVVALFKEYLSKGRCDVLKECINLYEQNLELERRDTAFQKQFDEMENSTREKMSILRRETKEDIAISNSMIEELGTKVSNVSEDIKDMKLRNKAIIMESIDSVKENYGEKAAKKRKRILKKHEEKIEEKIEEMKNNK